MVVHWLCVGVPCTLGACILLQEGQAAAEEQVAAEKQVAAETQVVAEEQPACTTEENCTAQSFKRKRLQVSSDGEAA